MNSTASPGHATPRLRLALEGLVAASLAFLVTWFGISASFESGRLALPATYDDVMYFIDAQQWLNGFTTHGWVGNLLAVINQHAPLSTLVGALGFALGGPNDWAPYAANSLLLALTFWLLLRYLRLEGLGLIISTVMIICIADIPFCQHTITEFRPDLFAGIATAFCVLWLFRKPAFLSRARDQFFLGLMFGLAMLAKPSEFLVVGFEIATAIVFSFAGFIVERKLPWKPQVRPILLSFAVFLLGATIVFGPYLAAQGRQIFEYIYLALFTLGDVNTAKITLMQQLAFYTVSDISGRIALGVWFWVGIATMLGRSAITIRSTRNELPTLCVAYATLFAVYLVVTLPSVKTYFLGSTFYAAFAFFMLRDWVWFAKHPWNKATMARPGYIGATLVALLVIQRALLPEASLATENVNRDEMAYVLQATRDFWELARDAAQNPHRGSQPVVVLANNPEPVRIGAVMLEGARSNLNLQPADGFYQRTVNDFLKVAETSDFTAITVSVNAIYPAAQIGNELAIAMDEDHRFRFVQTTAGGYVRIYETVARATPKN